jgi:Predicted periplasmic protein (DUF2092)
MRMALLLLVVLPLAACGGSKKSTSRTNLSPSAAVREAATNTAAKGSEHIGLNGTAVLSGQQVTVTGNGDFKGHAGTLHLDFNAGGLAGTIDAVVERTKLYMRSPLLLSSLAAGKTWLEIDIAKAANAGGALALSNLAAQDPAQTLERLGALKKVSKVGSEQVGGVATTHYRGKLTASATQPGGTYDLWIGDGDGYVHRVRVSSRLSATATLDATTDLSDFGKNVTVPIPSASETEFGTQKTLNLGG